jgi:transcriptional regulator with XRE-family HTH domain
MTGNQLRAIRKDLKLTQAQMAHKIGIAPNSVARLERDERRISEPLARLVTMIAAQKRTRSKRGSASSRS